MNSNDSYFLFLFVWVVIFSHLTKESEGKFIEDVQRCHMSDSNCIVEQANKIVKKYYKGDSQMGLIPIDPLKVDLISIPETQGQSVSVNLEFKRATLTGIRHATIHNIKFTNNTKDVNMFIKVVIPRFEITGDYTINGKVLILPIVGQGKSNISAENLDLELNLNGNFVEQNGKTFVYMKKFKGTAETTKVNIQFDNLFNGNSVLGESTNKLLNENWEGLWKDLRGGFLDTIGNVLVDGVNRIFQKHSYKRLFLE